MINIKGLEVGTNFSGLYALIHSAEKKFTADGKLYLDIMLQDMSGSIPTKIWDVSEEQLSTLINGVIVEISGDVTLYRKQKQVKIRTISVYEGMDVSHFLPSAPIEKDTLREGIYQYVFQIENQILSKIVSDVLDKYDVDFYVYPAASKNHHEYVSGLAHHVLSMLELSEFVISKYDFINKDLLYAGIILHDFGKIIELSGVVSTEYTTPGKLLGHITIACNEIYKIASDYGWENSEEVMVLQHLILSHHGKLEFGSPKVPVVVEAEILNILDNLDARMNMMSKALEEVEEGDFSPRVFSLENRKFYKHIVK